MAVLAMIRCLLNWMDWMFVAKPSSELGAAKSTSNEFVQNPPRGRGRDKRVVALRLWFDGKKGLLGVGTYSRARTILDCENDGLSHAGTGDHFPVANTFGGEFGDMISSGFRRYDIPHVALFAKAITFPVIPAVRCPAQGTLAFSAYISGAGAVWLPARGSANQGDPDRSGDHGLETLLFTERFNHRLNVINVLDGGVNDRYPIVGSHIDDAQISRADTPRAETNDCRCDLDIHGILDLVVCRDELGRDPVDGFAQRQQRFVVVQDCTAMSSDTMKLRKRLSSAVSVMVSPR